LGGGAGAGGGTAGFGGETSAGAGGMSDCDGAPPIDPALLENCSGENAITCVLGGEPGHYDVRLLLGGDGAGSTVVEAESRRFMSEQTETLAAEERCLSFSVNVREPEGQPIQDADPGTDGLNFYLSGVAPKLKGLGVVRSSPVVLFIAGDSTVCDQDPQRNLAPNARFTGWGQALPRYFKRGLSVTNYADSGEGTAAFRTDGGGLWSRIDGGLKSGDFVLIQLGHNDKETPAATYRQRVTGMVTAIQQKGAHPVLVTPIIRNNGSALSAQHIYGDLNVRVELTQIAQSENVPLIDLMQLSDAWANELGRSAAQAYFVGSDSTHTNELGAAIFAGLVRDAIAASVPALAEYLR
jgi:lysophospholipase L1-like esterase